MTSNSHSEDSRDGDNSNISDNSSISQTSKQNHQDYNKIIQEIVENESQKEVDMMEEISEDNEEIDTHPSNNDQNTLYPRQDTVIIQNMNHFLKMKELQDKELANSICDKDYK